MLYPSSPSVAAAEPPANPVPTIITLYLRLLAGFTSFISNLAFSHFCSIGPGGTRASSFMTSSVISLHDAHQNRQRYDTESHADPSGEQHGSFLEKQVVARMRNAQRLEHAPYAVIEVNRQKNGRHEVKQGD